MVIRSLLILVWVGTLLVPGCDRVLNLTEVQPRCTVDACQTAGGRCGSTGVCEIDCTGASCVCPRGLSCQLDVRGVDTRVDCRDAVDCSVRCRDDGHCENAEIQCGSGQCTVSCTTTAFSCNGFFVSCGLGPCSVNCEMLGSCQGGAAVDCGLSSDCHLACGQETCSSMVLTCQQAQSCTADCSPDGNNSCNGASFICQQAAACDLDCAGRPGCTSS